MPKVSRSFPSPEKPAARRPGSPAAPASPQDEPAAPKRHLAGGFPDIERIIELDFVRATEGAALNSLPWIGRGDKEAADAAACDAMRGMFDLMPVCAEMVIGEGIKDNAPGIFKGEHLGQWTPGTPRFDLAVDPIDGTTNISKGLPNSLSVLAAASPEPDVKNALQDIPSFYMSKLAYGPAVKRAIESAGARAIALGDPLEKSLPRIAEALGKRLKDLVVCMLDRPRHAELIAQTRSIGCCLRLISDGDIAAAIAPSIPESGIDVYVGIGGSPEAVLAAAALRCLDGDIQAQMWPRDEKERAQLVANGHGAALEKIYRAHDLARGSNIIFCATGITDSSFLPGVKVTGHIATTHSILMRAKQKTVRWITTRHNLDQKTIRLRSSKREHRV